MMAKTTNINGSWNRHSVVSSLAECNWKRVATNRKFCIQGSPAASYRLLSAKNITRPQLKFKEKIRNKPGPFVPKIKEKPHSLKPLAILVELNDFGDEEFSHPYEFELERFTPDPKFLAVPEVVSLFPKVKETPLVMVETEEGLKSLLKDLSQETMISVDLEVFIGKRMCLNAYCWLIIYFQAHSYRSFQGITCLMQISTSKSDYIVDTLELWDQLQPLNEIFCNPKIVKVNACRIGLDET